MNLVLFDIIAGAFAGWLGLSGQVCSCVVAIRGGWAALTCGLDGVGHSRCIAHTAGRAETVTGA